MINRRTVFEIHRLKDMQFSIRQIAKTLNMDRGTVTRYIKHPDITRKPRQGRPSKLDPFREIIKEMVERYPKVNAPEKGSSPFLTYLTSKKGVKSILDLFDQQ